MCKHTLETREPSCVSRIAKSFFILVIHSLLVAVGHVAAPKLPLEEVKPGATGHMTALELASAGMRDPELRDT
jgi:hypothetical protein